MKKRLSIQTKNIFEKKQSNLLFCITLYSGTSVVISTVENTIIKQQRTGPTNDVVNLVWGSKQDFTAIIIKLMFSFPRRYYQILAILLSCLRPLGVFQPQSLSSAVCKLANCFAQSFQISMYKCSVRSRVQISQILSQLRLWNIERSYEQ